MKCLEVALKPMNLWFIALVHSKSFACAVSI